MDYFTVDVVKNIKKRYEISLEECFLLLYMMLKIIVYDREYEGKIKSSA